jgi:hypothetical protein
MKTTVFQMTIRHTSGAFYDGTAALHMGCPRETGVRAVLGLEGTA